MSDLTLREEVSAILKFRVPEKGWAHVQHELWPAGRPDGKETKELIFLILRRLDELETTV